MSRHILKTSFLRNPAIAFPPNSPNKPQRSLDLAAQLQVLVKFNLMKCYANTFVKVDAQIEEECRQTISYLKGYSSSTRN